MEDQVSGESDHSIAHSSYSWPHNFCNSLTIKFLQYIEKRNLPGKNIQDEIGNLYNKIKNGDSMITIEDCSTMISPEAQNKGLLLRMNLFFKRKQEGSRERKQ